jgi:hypothetical protein
LYNFIKNVQTLLNFNKKIYSWENL